MIKPIKISRIEDLLDMIDSPLCSNLCSMIDSDLCSKIDSHLCSKIDSHLCRRDTLINLIKEICLPMIDSLLYSQCSQIQL